jgi:serine protease
MHKLGLIVTLAVVMLTQCTPTGPTPLITTPTLTALAPTSITSTATPEKPTTLKPRAIFPKPASTTVDPDSVSAGQIILKFHEGTHIRLRSGVLSFDSKQVTPAERLLLERVDLSDAQIQSDLDQINKVVQGHPPLNVSRLFILQEEEQLAANKAQGEAMSGEELADLDLYYNLTFDAPDVSRAEDLINWLNRLRSVEIAYPQPVPHGADGDLPPTTIINPPLSQGYLNKAPNGIDAVYAWIYPGGRGVGVKLVDVETGWHLDHEDLPVHHFYGNGLNLGSESHGTAVLGVLVARDNGFGATGIVPDAEIGWSSPILASFPNFVYFVAAAIDRAASVLSFGDVLLIEQQYPGGDGGTPCQVNANPCGCVQYAYAPVENTQADFDAIKNATTRGIIVVEAAGNGQMNLDAPHYEGRFDHNVRDSGAILVGAGGATNQAPLCFTNFGSRVDVQGWGNSVETLGYGDGPGLRINGDDARQWYTRSFGGTSSASPIVAGAICAIQGIRIARGEPKFGPTTMRALLRSTGTPQAASPKQIGPLPDLRKAIHSFLPQSAEFVSQAVPTEMIESQNYKVAVTLRNSGSTTWTVAGNYHLGSPNWAAWGVNRISVPSAVAPGEQVTFDFTVRAPAPGTYNFQWRMVQDGVEWFGDLTPNVPINVRTDNGAAFISQAVPDTMVAGQTYSMPVTMKNVGATYWSASEYSQRKYYLRSQNPPGNFTWGRNRVVLPTSVAPGTEVTFPVEVVAPWRPGTYNFQWQMMQDFYGSFGDLTPNVSIHVTPSANSAAFMSQSVPAFMVPDTDYKVSITMKNVGTSTWTANTPYKLGTTSPDGWDLDSVELPATVPPGALATFKFEVTAPSQSGSYDFQWRMVQGDAGWFGELTPNVTVLVRSPEDEDLPVCSKRPYLPQCK